MRKCFLMALLAMSILLTACGNEENNVKVPGEPTYMTVSLVGSSSQRASTPLENEDTIKDYYVYVFDARNNKLEAYAAGDPSKTTTLMVESGNAKRVTVIANLGEENYPTGSDVENYGDLAIRVDLDAQAPLPADDNGLVMTGEKTVTPVAGQSNSVGVKLERAVAKIVLGTITITDVPELELDITKLKLIGVSAQRVTREVTLFDFEWDRTPAKYYGGLPTLDTKSEVREYLADSFGTDMHMLQYANPYTLNNYFYVFPNQEATHCTLLTIEAEYDGETLYYPVRVNYRNKVNEGESVNGQYVERNTVYTLNLNLKNYAEGTEDPGIPKEDVELDVTISVKEWDTVIQNEEW